MKKLLLAGFVLWGIAAFAQNARFDVEFPSVSATSPPFLIANLPPNSPVVALCDSPANGTPCTNYATTYTSSGVACPNGAQDTPQPQPSACQATGDGQGNIGFWVPAGKYDYTLCIDTSCYGPFTITVASPSASSLVIDTNSTPNTVQGLLNFTNTTGAGGIDFTNPSGGVESATVANVQGADPNLLSSGTMTGATGATICKDASGGATTVGCTSGGSGGGNPLLENCTPDQTGNSFYTVASLTNWFAGHWEFVFNTTTYINCEVFIPTAQSGATLVLDIFANDSTAGHAALFQTCDTQITTGTLQVGSLTCASAQTYTTTSSAYQRVTLTFNVQSTLANNGMLAVKIGVSPTGTAPTANLLVFPHFIL